MCHFLMSLALQLRSVSCDAAGSVGLEHNSSIKNHLCVKLKEREPGASFGKVGHLWQKSFVRTSLEF